jgi:hypothetical protein
VYLYRLSYVVVAGTLAWVFVRHAEVCRQVRRTMVAMMALVLPVYWAVPMSPPRFALPGRCRHRCQVRHPGPGRSGELDESQPLRGVHPRLALLSWLFPLLMAADVLTTGNHYVLDVAGSVTLLAVSIGAASLWGRLSRRPGAL